MKRGIELDVIRSAAVKLVLLPMRLLSLENVLPKSYGFVLVDFRE